MREDPGPLPGWAKLLLMVLYAAGMFALSWALHTYLGPVLAGAPTWVAVLFMAVIIPGGLWAWWTNLRNEKALREHRAATRSRAA